MHRPTCGKCLQCTSRPNSDNILAPCLHQIPDYHLVLVQHPDSEQHYHDPGFKSAPFQEAALPQDIKQEFDITLFEGEGQSLHLGEEPQLNAIGSGCSSSFQNPSSNHGSNKSPANNDTSESCSFHPSSALSSILDPKEPLPTVLLVSPPTQGHGPPFASPAAGQRSPLLWHQDIQLPLRQQDFDHLPHSCPRPRHQHFAHDHSQSHRYTLPAQIMAPPLQLSGEGSISQSLAANAAQLSQEKSSFSQAQYSFERSVSTAGTISSSAISMESSGGADHEPFFAPLSAPAPSYLETPRPPDLPSASTESFCYFTMLVTPVASDANTEGTCTPSSPFGALTLTAEGSESTQQPMGTVVNMPQVHPHGDLLADLRTPSQGGRGRGDLHPPTNSMSHRHSAPTLTQDHLCLPQLQQTFCLQNTQNSGGNVQYGIPVQQQPTLLRVQPLQPSRLESLDECRRQSEPYTSVYHATRDTITHASTPHDMHVASVPGGIQPLATYDSVSTLGTAPAVRTLATPTVEYSPIPFDIQPVTVAGEDSTNYPRKRRSPSSRPISLSSLRGTPISPLPPALMEPFEMMSGGLMRPEETGPIVVSAGALLPPLLLENVAGISPFPSTVPFSLQQPQPQQQWQQWQQMQHMPIATALAPSGISNANNGVHRGLTRMHSTSDLQHPQHQLMATLFQGPDSYTSNAPASSSTASSVTFLSAPIVLPSYSTPHAEPISVSLLQGPDLGPRLQTPSQLSTHAPLQFRAENPARKAAGREIGQNTAGSKGNNDVDASALMLGRKKKKQKQKQSQPPRMKKPCNSYMWYRKETYKKNQLEFNSKKFPGSAISKEIAKAWNEEPESVKRVFEAKAELEKYKIMHPLPSYEVKSQAGRKPSRTRTKATAGLSMIMEMPIAVATAPPSPTSTSSVGDCMNIGAGESTVTIRSNDSQNNSHQSAEGPANPVPVRAFESGASQPYVYIIDDDPTESNENRNDFCREGVRNGQLVLDRNAYKVAAGTSVSSVNDPVTRQEIYSVQGSSAIAAISVAPIVAAARQQQQQHQILQLQLHHQQQQQQLLQQQLQDQYNGYTFYTDLELDHSYGKGSNTVQAMMAKAPAPVVQAPRIL